MQYTCIHCGAVGASGRDSVSPEAYNCHVCHRQQTMWPTTQAKIFLFEQRRWHESRDGDQFDSKVISGLTHQVNDLKAALLRSEQGAKNALVTLNEAVNEIADLKNDKRQAFCNIEAKEAQLGIAVKLFDQILPQAGQLCIDVGLLNDFLTQARK